MHAQVQNVFFVSSHDNSILKYRASTPNTPWPMVVKMATNLTQLLAILTDHKIAYRQWVPWCI